MAQPLAASLPPQCQQLAAGWHSGGTLYSEARRRAAAVRPPRCAWVASGWTTTPWQQTGALKSRSEPALVPISALADHCLWRLSAPATAKRRWHCPEGAAGPFIDWHGAQRWVQAPRSAAAAVAATAQSAGGSANFQEPRTPARQAPTGFRCTHRPAWQAAHRHRFTPGLQASTCRRHSQCGRLGAIGVRTRTAPPCKTNLAPEYRATPEGCSRSHLALKCVHCGFAPPPAPPTRPWRRAGRPARPHLSD